jgi:hypothetical protein
MNAKGFTISVMMRNHVDYVMRYGLRTTVSLIQLKNPYTITGSILSATVLVLHRFSWHECFLFVAFCTHQRPSLQIEKSPGVCTKPHREDLFKFCCCIIDTEKAFCPHWTLSLSHHFELADLAQPSLLNYACAATPSSTAYRTGHNIERIPQFIRRPWGWFQRLGSGIADAGMCNIRAVVHDPVRSNMHLRTNALAELRQ